MTATEPTDVPRQLRPSAAPDAVNVIGLAERYGLTPRTAGEFLRAMHREGVIGKRGRIFFGRIAAVDAWLCGASSPRKRGAR